ncbi:MAG: penicillin-binding protein 2 [Chloroflexi bacterium]|nr:penicillin-binding protein 2 [Chloroflexota bacterium]
MSAPPPSRPGIYRLPPDTFKRAKQSSSSEESVPKNVHPSEGRIKSLLGLIILFGALLAARLILYQLTGLPPQTDASGRNVIDKTLGRGTIADRNGHPLAIEYFQYNITADPLGIGPQNFEAIAKAYAPRLGTTPSQIVQTLEQALATNPNARYAMLASGVGPEIGESIRAEGYYTITAKPLPKRYYPEGFLAAPILGYVDADRRGQYGLERKYDSFLRASTRLLRPFPTPQLAADHDDLNNAITNSLFLPSYVQHDLILTLDRSLQYLAEQDLRQGIEQYEADGGVIIIMDPKTSAVLAMASWPTFNPNTYSDFADDPNIFINPAINIIYEPGSVFKLITYAAALDKGVITPNTVYQDEDLYVYQEQEIRNWDERSHGRVTTTEALAQSLNVPTAKIAVDLGANEFYKAVNRFGFGQNTGIELLNELPGIVKSPGKNGWYPGDLATNAFGQGISVTPLQMINAVAAIAAGGVRHRAYIVEGIINEGTLRATEPQALSRAISPETAATLTEMMVTTVDRMAGARIEGYRIAGKSGTAEIPLPGGYKDERTIASFTGFFPADDPQFVVLIKLDRPKTSRWATHTAAPLFQTVAQDIINLCGIPDDSSRQAINTSMNSP